MSAPSIAIVGATGAVGREMLAILEQRDFPLRELKLLASERSAGKFVPYKGRPVAVEPLTPERLRGVDIALFSAGGSVSKAVAPEAASAGCAVIDNSSAFRMDPEVPLVVPEINPEALGDRSPRTRSGAGRIIANPNCSTIILLMALTPLRNAFGVERAVVSTYQAASGAGAKGMEELEEQTRADLAGRRVEPRVFHEPYAFNLFSHNTPIDAATGLNVEELKVIKETHKIWGDPGVRLSVTCIRVPVRRAHAESVNVRLSRPATLQKVRETLEAFPGLRVVDDRAANGFPTPLKASGRDEVLVGRLRPDYTEASLESVTAETPCRGFDLFICGDQLRKGAALNAVQIAEMLARS